jgi:acyl-CoA synthetase (AMP-forming)/AMP-acid ligase II
VIYTSGSTGRPKAAMNTHRGVCNRLLALRNDFRLGESDTGLLKSTLSFDPSINETFWPLVSGGRLLILLAGEHRDISYLIGLIAEYEVTWINFVPSILRAFLDHPDSGRCRTLKYVVSGGEPLTFSLQRRFFSRMNAELHNVYGPTETAIGVTRWKCQQNGGSRIIPIGRPHANTRIYILDSRLEPVPVGVSGELHIGGVQVGRGYLNQPELTAEKFIPDPFCGEDGARLFKTGDVARYLPGGNIEFLERKDHQVKIRGVRIELGEIEACLEEHEMVSQAVVKVRDHGSENAKLVAYLTAKHEIQPGRLRAWLSERLPPEMLPARFIRLESFPLTSSQKLDRDALPPPPADKLVAAAEADGPRNESERQLLSIWEEVLRIEAPGIHDSFFALGGHSLLAQQVMNRLYHVTGRQYSVALLFRNPTVARMARKLAEMSSEDLGS